MKHITVKQLTLCLTLTFSCLFINAQTVSCYFPSNYAVDAGSTFTVDIMVDSFINVGGLGLSVNWDPTVLQFKETRNLGITLGELSGFNDVKAVSHGELGLSWINSSVTVGKTLPDSSILFSILFDVVGVGGDTTSLKFTDTPVAREFADLQPSVIPSTYLDASVMVNGTSNTYYNSSPEKITIYPPSPNPFYENTFLKVELEHAAQTTIKIIDQLGKVLYEDQQYLNAGEQSIPIAKEIFSQSGTYYCLLHANDFRVTQKLIFIDR